MKSPAWNIHLFRYCGLVQGCQLAIELVSVVGLDARLAALFKKRLQPLVTKRFNHVVSVSLGDTRYKSVTAKLLSNLICINACDYRIY